MKNWFYALVMLLIIALCAFPPSGLYAEQVLHNGFMVDSEAPAKDCLSCHDSSLAGDVIMNSHPMTDYPPERNRKLYASVDEIRAQGLKIIDGKVTCISCHNLMNPGKFHLVVEHPEICIICHIGW